MIIPRLRRARPRNFSIIDMKRFYSFIAVSSLALAAMAQSGSDEWIRIGTGAYTDFVVSSIYDRSPRTLPVEFEQNAQDPTIYRIKQPYAAWDDWRAEGLSYDASTATPMVIHVVDDTYAWFESFNTGLLIDTADAYGPIVGGITVVPMMEGLITTYGIEQVISKAPTALCTYSEGTMTLTATYSGLGGTNQPNVRIDVAGEPIWRGNKNGVFKLQLPTATDLNPEMKWNTLEGKALFVDGFTSLFAYLDEPVYPVLEVEMQQNEADPTLYRIVNPYAGWNVDYSAYDFTYDDQNNYYMTLYTFPEFGLACTDTFLTGLSVRVKGEEGEFEMFGVQNQAYYFYESYTSTFGWYLSETAEEFGYMFGILGDEEITYPAFYEDEYSGQVMEFPTFTGWTGSYDEALEMGWIYTVNKEGRFKVVFPRKATDGIKNTAVASGEGESPEYYDLTGRRIMEPKRGMIVIERRGPAARKVIF